MFMDFVEICCGLRRIDAGSRFGDDRECLDAILALLNFASDKSDKVTRSTMIEQRPE